MGVSRARLDSSNHRPLRILFLDINAYFASVEQADRADLLGRPVAVAPVIGRSGTIIAASYEAKAFGVKTGMKVGEGRDLCPDLQVVDARHGLYVQYHKRVLEAVDTVLPVEKVRSVDEMSFRLLGDEMKSEVCVSLAKQLKSAIKTKVAENITCSIGIAPNTFLAKLATDLQKPDGLVVIRAEDLPERLKGLDLKTFAGINTKIEARLRASGIFSSDELIDRTPEQLRRAFGSVTGERWWYLLRGYEIAEDREDRKSLGHSSVLAPKYRTRQGCHDILMRLIQKSTARLRGQNLRSSEVHFSVVGYEKSWHISSHLPAINDDQTVLERFNLAWGSSEFEKPYQVGLTFTNLSDEHGFTGSLFDDQQGRESVSEAVDRINAQFGKNAIHLANVARTKDEASEKIAFDKTELFSEGKGDND